MADCLYAPYRGYYAGNIHSIGSRGDFTTAPQLSAIPAAAIAAWATGALRKHHARHLIEVGPGLGTLAKQVLGNLPLSLRLSTRLHLVESSPKLAAHQKALLKNKATYHPTILDALAACSGNAVIYSNELVDAFPVRLFEKTETSWREIAVEKTNQGIREILLPPATLPPSSVFNHQFPVGQRVEIHDSYRLWLESWLPHWNKGEMLTVDYGNPIETLYHRRPTGSLRAYLLHHRLEGLVIYQNPGLQDITADVNFTDLIQWSAPWLKSQTLINFSDFTRPFYPETDARLSTAFQHFNCLIQTPRS
ncbi:MAG: SAM-dependent methyltransferase [Armatimonadetes bacterium]|nr:SAM-dependent methyltransferase [Akkermansiaceae bacterium]